MGKPKNKRRRDDSGSDEDDTFYYRYPSAAPPPQKSTSNPAAAHGRRNPSSGGGGGGGSSSGGLVPSKSTLYVSNLDFSLTNSDLHTLFSTFGKIARVTILKDRATRRSRGVAFVQFVSQPDAQRAAAEMHDKILNGRKVAASIAIDNGRAPEFIKKRVYKDKSKCYECGEDGHLSYECPKNILGPRERPAPKKGRRGGGGREEWGGGGGGGGSGGGGSGGGGDDEGEVFEEENWASVVDDGADERLLRREREEREERERVKERREKKVSYFSDESDEEDE